MTYGNNAVSMQGKSWVTADSGALNLPELGSILNEGDEQYIFVHNAGGTDLAPSYGAVLSAVSGYSVTISSVAGADFLVGVCKHATIPSGGYGWLLRRGFVEVGGLLCLAADGAFNKAEVSGATTTATTVLNQVCGKAMEAIASGGSGTAYISVF